MNQSKKRMTSIGNYIKARLALHPNTKPGIELILDSVFNIAYAPKLNTTVESRSPSSFTQYTSTYWRFRSMCTEFP